MSPACPDVCQGFFRVQPMQFEVENHNFFVFLSPFLWMGNRKRVRLQPCVLLYGSLCVGYDLFSMSQMNWHGWGAARRSPHLQGGLDKSFAIPILDKQVSFLHSATARPPGTNYSISFLDTRGRWNVFLCPPPPPPSKWLIVEGGSGYEKRKKCFNHVHSSGDI